jgi:threonyl-tRNA synthetase
MERFIGVLIEHFAGAFPLWLAPEQARVLSVSDKSEAYGQRVLAAMQEADLRVKGDFRAEKLGSKIRDAQLELIPYMIVVGPRDEENGTVSVRDRIDGDLGAMSLEAAIKKLAAEVAGRTVRQSFQSAAAVAEKTLDSDY